jgi:hypothetical protein
MVYYEGMEIQAFTKKKGGGGKVGFLNFVYNMKVKHREIGMCCVRWDLYGFNF